MRLGYYSKIWWLLTKNAFLVGLAQRLGFAIFLFGKLVRFVFLFVFIVFLTKGTNGLASYSSDQVVFFFLSFYFVDTLAQFFYREAYRFRPQVVSGSFDLTLSKPVNALFKSLAGGADVIDFAFMPIILFFLIKSAISLQPTFLGIILYLVLLVNSFLIATAFHVFVLSMGIITLEIDHMIMVYRDLAALGRFPVEIYKQPLRGLVMYVLPIGVMFTFPAKALLGLLSFQGVVVSFMVGIITLFLTLKFWNYSLRYYTSASS